MKNKLKDSDFLKIIAEKADLFDYLCWLENMRLKDLAADRINSSMDHLCISRDNITFWGSNYIDAVRQAAAHDKNCQPD